jgi:DNA ligase (NAD+)
MDDLSSVCQSIDEANHYYYQLGHSIVSDREFEILLGRLRKLDPTNPRLTNVGVEPTLDKVEHDYPMGSLDNIDINKSDELRAYLKRNSAVGSMSYHVTPKVDGSSIAIYYKGGKLDKVLTRGNGFVGQDITAKAMLFKNVPQTIGETAEVVVRGEAVMLREDFRKYIESTESTGVKNPRNVGNGLIVRKDLMGAGLIHFYAFGCYRRDHAFTSVLESYEFLRVLGFVTVDCRISDEQGLKSTIDGVYSDKYPFDVDGVVVKVNETAYRDVLNHDGDDLRPRSDKAVKYNSKKAETVVTGVNITVGSTGKITPTLAVQPVEIGGVVVSNVLIYNFEEPTRLGIGVGDKIVVVLAGDVIPKAVAVVDKLSTGVISPPDCCPSCQQSITQKSLKGKLSVDYYCTNLDCPGIKFERIKNFIGSSKRGMGILGIGDNLIAELIASGLVKSFSDLYKLTVQDIASLKLGNGVLGIKRATAIVENIARSKSNPTTKVIGSLGVYGFAESRVELIVANTDLDLSTLADWADLDKIRQVSKLRHHYLPEDVVVQGTNELTGMRQELLELVACGFQPDDSAQGTKAIQELPGANTAAGDHTVVSNSIFVGKRFCFTGTREHIRQVEAAGGVIKSGVSKDLDYLVQKDASSESSKSTKARSLGITVISIDQVKQALENNIPF